MHRLRLLNQMRKVFIPGPAIAGTVTAVTVAAFGVTKVVHAAKPPPPPPPPPPPKDCDPNKPLVRAKDLPIYFDPESKLVKPTECVDDDVIPEDALMCFVRWSRAEIWKAKAEIDNIKSRAWNFVEVGQSHAQNAITQLQESDDANTRYGVIGAGAFLGFLFSLRGGFFKKIIYTSTGAAAAAALCFPEEAENYSSQIYELYQEYSSIAYHFAQAAIKDLTGSELSVPEFVKTNPVETVKVWISRSSDSDNVSKSSPSSASLLPPLAETPSHVVPVTLAPSSSASLNPGSVPMPPLEKPSKSESYKSQHVRDQSNPADKDMYSLRG